jgi:4,5-DOPA dioxygenase extradiol
MALSPIHRHTDNQERGSIIYLTHGGGPLPLLGDPRHAELVGFMQEIPKFLINPSAIVVISAHWEDDIPAITNSAMPELLYDYYGFPEESYNIGYNPPGAPLLAQKIAQLFQHADTAVRLNTTRGLDHGVFVPLKIMYPNADIPCLQVSLLDSLLPDAHINLGKILAPLLHENILIIGSGSSFHNLRAFRERPTQISQEINKSFEQWLRETLMNSDLSSEERERRLVEWQKVPGAEYCHPREEHLLPLHVCYGVTCAPAKRAYSMVVMDREVSAYIW